MQDNPVETGSTHAADTGNDLSNTIPIIEAIPVPVGGAFHATDNDLPHRFKQSTFRLYEPFIAAAIKTRDVVEINPSPLRATTFAARCRDAIIAKKRFNWPASFSTLELEEAKLVVRHGDQTVVIGPSAKCKGTFPGETLAFKSVDHKRLAGIIVDVEPTLQIITAFAVLLSDKLITGPVIFKRPVEEQVRDNIEATFDVAFMAPNEKGETILL